MTDHPDRELGMNREITRRDFLNGVAITAGASLLSPEWLAALGSNEEAYPPALTGLRGDHVGSFEPMHALRDGKFWEAAGKPRETGESYDLVVVGGGLSGLAAAYFFRRHAGNKARVLILDNHDDFGGHAKRNEFKAGSRTMLGFGGTFSIESPWPYSAVAKGVVEDLGIDVPSYSRHVDKSIYRSRGLKQHIFFDKESFGSDRLVVDPAPIEGGETGRTEGPDEGAWKRFLEQAPFSEKARSDFERLFREEKDYLPGLSSAEKKAKLARMSCAKYWAEIVGISDEVVKLYAALPHPLFGVGLDAVSAQDAWGLGLPGFLGLKLDPSPGPGMNRDAIRNEEAEKYFFHFPDGNATLARLLVRKLIPEAVPGNSVPDVVTARAAYSKLDDAKSAARIRLNSTAVRVRHMGEGASPKEVEISYSRGGKLETVRAKNCVLACWHVAIPYLCPDLPEAQKTALKSAEKVPLLYTNVALKNWHAFEKLGVNTVYGPGLYHTRFNLDLPVSIGEYQCSKMPSEPIVIHMMKTPCKPGLPARAQHRFGRMQLYTTPFETIERNVREELGRVLGTGGFDPARDIAAITVNRWPHGYAYQYNSLFDSFWLEGGELPCKVASKPFGQIAIANADAAAYAYTDASFDEAHRAVKELVGS